MRRFLATLVVLALALGLPACNGSGDDAGGGATAAEQTTTTANTNATTTTTEAAADPRNARLRLVELGSFVQPLDIAFHPNEDRLYVVEKTGRVVSTDPDGSNRETALDLRDDVSRGGEQGLLGLVFHPDGDRLYVNYTDEQGDTQVVEYAFADGQANPRSRRVLLTVEQPFSNHNGGHVTFGPDGHLYIGLGDGGSAHDPLNHAQNVGTLLGTILRIDPDRRGRRAYTIPEGNPFAGERGARPEIWHFGLRNPWRFSFDRATGEMWIADVGQSAREEINRAGPGEGGLNFGWPRFEGTRLNRDEVELRGEATMPVFDYPRSGGACSVTGGYVYRGTEISDLVGSYVFGDYCQGRLFALAEKAGGGFEAVALGPEVDDLAAFAENASGELYVMSLTGAVYRLAPA